MIVYSDRRRHRSPREMLIALTCEPTIAPDGALEALLEWGELESGVADWLCPEYDRSHPLLDTLRAASIAAAHRYLGLQPAHADPAPIDPHDLPEQISISTPEGYAWYGLHPDVYVESARRLWRDLRPHAAKVIGIRSIGASLSAGVAATLEEFHCTLRSYTVRPRGHPFDRRLVLSSELAKSWRAAGDALFVIVDEGPGISGSSFAAVARTLAEIGVPSARIGIFTRVECRRLHISVSGSPRYLDPPRPVCH